MKRLLYTMLLLLLIGACAKVPTQGERAILLAEEVERLAGLRSLWPGFEPMVIPLAIYDGQRTYLFRHPAPPEGFVKATGTNSSFYTYENRHPAITANTSADIGGTMTATLMIDSSGSDRSLTDLAAVALHEGFHVFQREHHPGWLANEAALFVYPSDDAKLLTQRRLETEALRRALAAPSSAGSACWTIQALTGREERFAEMDPEFAAYERATEMNEGLATYVELRAKGLEVVELPAGGFAATEVRRRAYSTGPALGLLLDRFHQGWQASFETDDEQNLDQALRMALGSDKANAPGECTFSDAEIAETDRVAGNDVEEALARQVERRAAFEARPGWRVVVEAADGAPLWPQGFDPLNVERVEGGILHTRFLRLGNDSGKLEAIRAEEADIEALTVGSGPHPLFNGVQRVVIAGLAKPEIVVEGEQVSVRATGFTADFNRATVHDNEAELVFELAPVD